MPTLSPAFKDRIVSIHGLSGQKWLDNLPALQADLVQRWSLQDIKPVPNLSYNYLAFASTTDGDPVVLKMGVPHQEMDAEIHSLRLFEGEGHVRLLDADPLIGALLLERITPGDDLRTIEDDQEATHIAAQLMRKIWKPIPTETNLPTSADWCQGFQRYLNHHPGSGPLPADLVHAGTTLAAELLRSPNNQLLLHGDLHHMNILLGENDNWIAIDPKGVIGEEAFEVGALILNPIPDLVHWPNLMEVQKQRLKILAEELSIDLERLNAWSYVRAVLSAIWSLEDGEDWDYGIKVAKVLKSLL